MIASPSQTPEAAQSPSKALRSHSCVLCQQRKVRCDRQNPCSNCVKTRAECVPSFPTAPRRRRRKASEQDMVTKMRRYERLLKKHGVKLDEDDIGEEAHHGAHGSKGCPKGSRGLMLTDRHHSRYIENTLWEHLRDEITDDPKEALQTSSDEDEANDHEFYPNPERFLIEHDSAPKSLRALHPQPVHIFRLWQTYLDNCNPLLKLFHAPTMQQVILEASSDLENIPRHTEALMFSIYLVAVTSLTNQECESMLGESRTDLLTRYSHAIQQALANARFLKSLNLSTLQALCIYLLSLRRALDHHSMWVLTGVAVRIAVRLGIHHDGANYQIPPFEAEIRRRTWWQIAFLDGQASKLAGVGFPTWMAKFDMKLPLNVSDSDLTSTMKEPPPEKDGATEVMFCRLRAEGSRAFLKTGCSGLWSHFRAPLGPEGIPERDKVIDELEVRFQEQYIRYCDPSIPLHALCIYVAKSVVCTHRLLAHHPRQYPDKGATIPPEEKDILWRESLKGLELAISVHLDKSVQRFLWHTYVQFHLDAFIYVLNELRVRTTGEQVERAWQQVEVAYDHRPEMISENKNTLYFAIGNLCLRAWTKHEEAGGRFRDGQMLPTPRYISLLRSQRKIPTDPSPPPQLQQPTPDTPLSHKEQYMNSNQAYAYATTEHNAYEPMSDQGGRNMVGNMPMPEFTSDDWAYWQTLMDGDLPTYGGEPSVPPNLQNWVG